MNDPQKIYQITDKTEHEEAIIQKNIPKANWKRTGLKTTEGHYTEKPLLMRSYIQSLAKKLQSPAGGELEDILCMRYAKNINFTMLKNNFA